MTDIYVKVEPDSDEFRVEDGKIPKIYLEEPAENNRANAELVRKIGQITGAKTGIISGHRSRRKKLSIDLPEREFKDRLEEDS